MHERLETERLVLRMFGNDDLEPYLKIGSDPQVMFTRRTGALWPSQSGSVTRWMAKQNFSDGAFWFTPTRRSGR